MLDADAMERRIREYFDACNEANFDKIQSHFVRDAVHYFPPGMYGGPFVGAEAIAQRWLDAVRDLGSMWTIDQMIIDAPGGRAVIEWSHFKTAKKTLLRGDEWYVFDQETALITEIRAYYAAPQDPSRSVSELEGFDYRARGYVLDPPFNR